MNRHNLRQSILLLALTVAVMAVRLPAGAQPAGAGTFVSLGQLGLSSYDTPENAFETVMWALVNGKFDVYVLSFTPEFRGVLTNADNNKAFGARARRERPNFKGYEIVAEKKISDDKVDLKFFIEYVDGRKKFGLPDGSTSEYGLQLMVRVDDQWKAAGAFRAYDTNWDNPVINFVPPENHNP